MEKKNTTLAKIENIISNKERLAISMALKYIPYSYRKRCYNTQADAARDVIQGTYLKLLSSENIPELDDDKDVLRYFATSMRNYAITLARKANNARKSEMIFEIGHEVSPDDKVDTSYLETCDPEVYLFEAQDAWNCFVEEMKDKGVSQKEVDLLSMIYLNEHTFADVGAVLGCNSNSISGYVFRAKELIKSRLAHHGAHNASQAMALVG